jgi:hypothetical protein
MLAPEIGWAYSQEKMPSITPVRKLVLPKTIQTSKIAPLHGPSTP